MAGFITRFFACLVGSFAALACAAGEPAGRTSGKPGAPVTIESAIPQPIQPTMPGRVVLTLLPAVALDGLRVSVRGEPGLVVQSGGMQEFVSPAAGVPLIHEVTVLASSVGSFHISVVLTVAHAGRNSGRAIRVPVPVGAAAQMQLRKPQAQAAQPASGAERIKALRATEEPR